MKKLLEVQFSLSRTPDYGTWGRGTKYNDGSPEVNASSIGLTKAALEVMTFQGSRLCFRPYST